MFPTDQIVQNMLTIAKEASSNAYCPYSKFPVGAAVLTESGQIFGGCNVENASFGLTICAERNAIFQAVAKGFDSIKAVAVFTRTDTPAAPCGACRQVICEFGSRVEIFMFYGNGEVFRSRSDELLPLGFDSKHFISNLHKKV